MADSQYTDPRIYGGTPMSPFTETEQAAPATPEAAEPVRRDVSTAGLQSAAQGEAAMREAGRPTADLSRSIEAAAYTWTTTRILRSIAQPSFAHEQGYNPAVDMKGITARLALDEEEFLLESRSTDEFRYRLGELDKLRSAHRDMGDNPVTSTLTAMLDPAYIGVDIATLGISRAARLGRLATAGMTAASTAPLDLVSASQAPVSTGEILANALINGAATGLFYNPRLGRLEPKAPDYPEAELRAATAAVDTGPKSAPTTRYVPKVDAEGNPMFSSAGKPLYTPERAPAVNGRTLNEAAQVARVVDEAVQAPPRAHPDYVGRSGTKYRAVNSSDLFRHVGLHGDAQAAPLARALQERVGPMLDNLKVYVLSPEDLKATGRREAFVPAENAVYLSQTSSPQIMLHEVAHAATVDKIRFARENPGSAHAEVVRDLDRIRTEALREARTRGVLDADFEYLTKNTEEFVAGLFTGDTSFTKLLGSMRDPTGSSKNLLSRMVEAVRKVLGLGIDEGSAFARSLQLTDDLLDAPLLRGTSGMYQAPPSAAAVGKHVDSLAKKAGEKVAWNTNKTLAQWNRRVADALVDNPLDPSGRSVESQSRAIRADLTVHQIAYDDLVRSALAEDGFGIRQRIIGNRQAVKAQADIERSVAMEMLARDDSARRGITHVSQAAPRVQKMADALDKVAKAALSEMQRSGVRGAEAIEARAGYFSRKWSSANLQIALDRMAAIGIDKTQGTARLRSMMSDALRRANGWERELSDDVAKAILDRTARKGEFTDSAFRAHIGNEALAEVRDILTGSGIKGERLQRAMDVLAGQVDEAGKAPFLKHRVDMDMSAQMMLPDGTALRLSDLLDTNLTSITDRYLDTVAGQSAFARNGLYGPTDISKLRQELIAGATTPQDKQEAAALFDNVTAALLGRPVGDEVPQAMRKLQAVTQMVGLASSGLWQVTEYATTMARYGLGKTLKYTLANMPGFRNLFTEVKANREVAEHLQNVLARHSYQDVRLRPFIQRLEDNYEFPLSDQVHVGLQQAKQLVPYLNGMKFIHHHQAQVVGNLVTDIFAQAARGNDDAAQMLRRYGMSDADMLRARESVAQHGLDTAQWSDEAWDAVRPTLSKMMDESVLRNRIGDMPAFAQFNSTGKFIFTFRSFVLGAHNKLLAGGLARDGFMGVGLIALYQMPLSLMAVTVDNTVKGKEPMTDGELVGRAMSQMGILGMFSDLAGIITGEKQQFGAPGLIAVDRALKFGGNAAQGKFGQAGNDLLNAVPLLSLIPGIKAIGENLK